MGLSVFNQVNSKEYFCISSIDKNILYQKGIPLSVSEFKEIVRKSPPFTTIITGSDMIDGRQRRTNIYKYDDFLYLSNNKAEG